MYKVYCCILAGGCGERLWPLSRQHCPKQLLKLGNKTLLEHAIDRALMLVPHDYIYIITTAAYETAVRHIAGDIHVLVESEGRNTAPAIMYSCMTIEKRDADAIVLYMPSDAFIPSYDYVQFEQCMQRVIKGVLQHNGIVLCGAKPTYAATGYGYIEYVPESDDLLYKVCTFYEKPSLERAQQFMHQQNMLWNMGIFCGRIAVFIEECKKTAPLLYEALCAYDTGNISYAQVPAVSFDHAVIEKSTSIWVIPAEFSWTDVGTIATFLHIKNIHEHDKRPVITIDAHNNSVDVPDKLVALVGVSDLCVIQTADALLIVKRDDVEKVRSVVQYIKQLSLTEYL